MARRTWNVVWRVPARGGYRGSLDAERAVARSHARAYNAR